MNSNSTLFRPERALQSTTLSILIKLGSSSVLDSEGSVNQSVIEACSRQVSNLLANGYKVALVCSGTVAAGRAQLSRRGMTNATRAECALIGQHLLRETWQCVGAQFGLAYHYHLLVDQEIASAAASWRDSASPIISIFNGDDARIGIHDQVVLDNDRLTLSIARTANVGRIFLVTQPKGQGGAWGTGGFSAKQTLLQEMNSEGFRAEMLYVQEIESIAHRLHGTAHLAEVEFLRGAFFKT